MLFQISDQLFISLPFLLLQHPGSCDEGFLLLLLPIPVSLVLPFLVLDLGHDIFLNGEPLPAKLQILLHFFLVQKQVLTICVFALADSKL